MIGESEIIKTRDDIIKILTNWYGITENNIDVDGVYAVAKRYMNFYEKHKIKGKIGHNIIVDSLNGDNGAKKSIIKAFGMSEDERVKIIESRNKTITDMRGTHFEECKKRLIETFGGKEWKIDFSMFRTIWADELSNVNELNKRAGKKIIRVKNPKKFVETILDKLPEKYFSNLGIDTRDDYLKTELMLCCRKDKKRRRKR